MTRLVRFSNNAVSQLAANLTNSGTSLSVTSGDGAKFPTISGGQYFMATLVKADGSTEVVKVTARSTDTMTIVRAAEPVAGASTSYAFSAGDRIEHRLTSGALGSEIDRLDSASLISPLNKSANYTITSADITSMVRVSTGSGNITITLPDTTTLTDDFDVLIAKVTSDANSVVVTRSGSDTINGANTYNITGQWQTAWLIADRANGTWTAVVASQASFNAIVDSGVGAGSATLTLTADPGSKNNLAFFVGGTYQQKGTYSVSGTTLTAGAAIPSGVTWEAYYTAPLSIGTPADASVTTVKLADANVTPAKLDRSYTEKSSATGSAKLPVGSTAQRDGSPADGYARVNSDTNKGELYINGAWRDMGGGATGAGQDQVFFQNGQTVNNDYTIPSGQNAGSFGPITIATGKTVTVPTGSVWTIV